MTCADERRPTPHERVRGTSPPHHQPSSTPARCTSARHQRAAPAQCTSAVLRGLLGRSRAPVLLCSCAPVLLCSVRWLAPMFERVRERWSLERWTVLLLREFGSVV